MKKLVLAAMFMSAAMLAQSGEVVISPPRVRIDLPVVVVAPPRVRVSAPVVVEAEPVEVEVQVPAEPGPGLILYQGYYYDPGQCYWDGNVYIPYPQYVGSSYWYRGSDKHWSHRGLYSRGYQNPADRSFNQHRASLKRASKSGPVKSKRKSAKSGKSKNHSAEQGKAKAQSGKKESGKHDKSDQ